MLLRRIITITSTPRALRNSSPTGAATTTIKVCPAASLPVALATTLPAISFEMMPKKIATPPPHSRAAIFVHHGSGSKRSTNWRNVRVIARGIRQQMARRRPRNGPLAKRKPLIPTSIKAAPTPITTASKTGAFLAVVGIAHACTCCGAACGYCAALGPGMVGAVLTNDWKDGVNCASGLKRVIGSGAGICAEVPTDCPVEAAGA